MEATLSTIPSSSKPPFPSSSYSLPSSLSLKSHFQNTFSQIPKTPISLTKTASPKFTIKSAISRTKKEETVETVKTHLQNCHLLAGIRYKGFTVQQFRELRQTLPPTTKLVVAKNTLVLKAIENTQWEALKPCMKGMNAWLFVHSEEIPAAIKPYRTFQREKKVENDFAGAVFEGKFYEPEEFKVLENLPTRAEVYAKLLGTLNGPASAVVGTLQAPARNLLLVLKAYIKKLEEAAESV